MSNKNITFSLLGLVLLIFLVYFLILNTLFLSGQPIKNHLNSIIRYAQQDKWEEAELSANELLKLWNESKYFIAINYAEVDYSLFKDNIARLEGAIKTRDDTETVSQAESTLKLWDNFIKVIPEP